MPENKQSDLKNSNILFLVSLLIGVVTLIFLPVTPLDRLPILSKTSVLADKNILSFQSTNSYDPTNYLVCSIDDDPEGYNNYGVYHPVDLAITINKLNELNIKHLFLGTHLHWPDLDPQENATLNTAITGLDSCIISVPLRRSVGSIEIPSYLLASSLSADSIHGDLNYLPRVNNLSLAPTFIIPENTQAGFSQLESESLSRKIPLLALWGERVILSSLLLERLHHLNIIPTDIVINMGENIILGDSGNIIPIDELGYFSPSDYPSDVKPDLISSIVTDQKQSPVDTTNSILTSAGLKADSYRTINQPVTQLNQLTLTPVVSEKKIYQPLHFLIHLAALIGIIYLLISNRNLKGCKNLFWIILLVLFSLGLAAVIARSSSYYLVTTHLVIAVLTASVCTFIINRRDDIIANSSKGYVDFDDISNSFKKTTASPVGDLDAKQASKQRKRERKKNASKKTRSNKTI